MQAIGHKQRQLEPLGLLAQNQQDDTQEAQQTIANPQADVGRELSLAYQVLAGRIENPVEDRHPDAHAEPRSLASAPVHDAEREPENREHQARRRQGESLVHDRQDVADHPLPGFGMLDGAGP